MDDAADAFEPHAVARFEGGDQRLPPVLLAAVQRLVGVGAVAQRVRFGVAQQAGDGRGAVGADVVDGEVGEVAQGERLRVDLLALRAPFGGERFGQRLARDDLRCAALRADRPAVERDAPGAVERLDRDLLPEALHWGGVRHLRARYRGTRKASSSPITMKPYPTRRLSSPPMFTTSRTIVMPRMTKATPPMRMSWITIQRLRASSSDGSGGRLAIEHLSQLRRRSGHRFGTSREQLLGRVVAPGD